jgi:hypothetical protein
MPTSSFGCMLFDALIAVWFLVNAPSIYTLLWFVQLGVQSSRSEHVGQVVN